MKLTTSLVLTLCAFLLAKNIAEVSFSSSESVKILNGEAGFCIAHIDGWKQISSPGVPMVPALPVKITIDGKYRISDIYVIIEQYEDIKLPANKMLIPGEVSIARIPENKGKKRVFKPDMSIYNSDKFFPSYDSYTYGFDGKNTIVSVLVSARYNPTTGILKIPRSGKIIVSGKHELPAGFRSSILTESENVIITSLSLISAAESLAALHRICGIPTSIVTVEWISLEYDTASAPPYDGYPSIAPAFEFTYDYILARKIISFLADDDAHPNLNSVTILGDADIVPPSFYYFDGGFVGDWDAFIPSDFLYSSPDFDWIAQFGVGRLPIRTNEEVLNFVQKERGWVQSANAELFSKVLFAGGKPFGGVFFDDEHSMMHIANEGISANCDWHKLYTTRESFTANQFDSYYSQDWGFICEMGHGSGYAIYFDDDSYWGVDELRSAVSRDFLPILFVGVCLDGMFDQELIPSMDTCETFAEACVKTAGGPIALFAATRTSFGVAVSSSDSGFISVECEEYITEIGYDLARVLQTSPRTLGDLYKMAVNLYTTENDMMESWNIETIFEFICHGDPALILPNFAIADTSVQPPQINMPTAMYLGEMGGIEMPVYHEAEIYCNISNAISSYFSNYIETDVSLLHISDNDELNISPTVSGFYHISSDAATGAETRIYTLESPSDIIVDGNYIDWVMFSHDPVATDPVDFSLDWLELRDIYAFTDEMFLYLGYTISGSEMLGRCYQLALDFRPGGYTGIPGVTTDGSGIYVCFPSSHAVDVIASIWFSYYFYHPYLFGYEGDYWSVFYFDDIGGMSVANIENGFVEMAFPLVYFGTSESISLILYSAPDSSYADDYPAQDCAPSDPASYTILTTGSEYANTLTNFVTIHLPSRVASTQNSKEAHTISVFPNPFNSSCIISTGDFVSKIEIVDLNGRIVDAIRSNTNSSFYIWAPKPNTESGIYFVKAYFREGLTKIKQVMYLK